MISDFFLTSLQRFSLFPFTAAFPLAQSCAVSFKGEIHVKSVMERILSSPFKIVCKYLVGQVWVYMLYWTFSHQLNTLTKGILVSSSTRESTNTEKTSGF